MRAVSCAIVAATLAAPALAQDAIHGKSLYKTYCQVCHTVDPVSAPSPFNNIMKGANNPPAIVAAASVDPSQMGWIPTTLSSADIADIAAYLGTQKGTAPTVNVVEFYNVARDHYFMSASAQEIADLDNGVHPGWMRTGLSFKAYTSSWAGTSPVCRFYIPPANGDSHFYSASPAECAQVAAQFPGFVYESAAVFHIGLPDMTTGACAPGSTPVYRVWDNRPDTNHRYTTSAIVRAQMLGQGWIGEGYGPSQVIMCAPG